MTTTLSRSRCCLRVETLEDRLAPSANMVLQWNNITRDAIKAGMKATAAYEKYGVL